MPLGHPEQPTFAFAAARVLFHDGLAVARRDRPLAPSNRSVAGAQRRLGSTAATQVEIAVAPGQAAAMNSVLKR